MDSHPRGNDNSQFKTVVARAKSAHRQFHHTEPSAARAVKAMSNQPSKQIGIAIVEHDRHVLVGKRQAGQDLAGMAEFPGGKCEPHESSDTCAARECLEETGIAVEAVRRLDTTRFDYPHASVELHFWLCRVVSQNADQQLPLPTPQNAFQWKPVDQLQDLTFPEGNARVLSLLDRELPSVRPD